MLNNTMLHTSGPIGDSIPSAPLYTGGGRFVAANEMVELGEQLIHMCDNNIFSAEVAMEETEARSG